VITLTDIGPNELRDVLALCVEDAQKDFVPTPEGILARAWAYRDEAARMYAIRAEGKIAGLTLVYELTKEPACYCVMEMLIDRKYQNQGIATEALRQIVQICGHEGKYPVVELSVDRENTHALRVCEKAGFVDAGYVDPALPQYRNLIYKFPPV
jgi:RimJ/RimL family protein N-acetyltransferase